jgi:protein-L-isoaspartate(D-aspartate) O-methyltransferase
MQDTYRHKGLRRQMVQELKALNKIADNVLEAMDKIPRHVFLDGVFVEKAYENQAFPIAAGQTISHPFTVGLQSTLLEIKKGENVLEIGTGSGYQTCVLVELGAKVVTIERQKELFTKTKSILPKIGYIAKTFFGDGYKGNVSYAPYDKIIVTCGAPFIPEALIEQLKVNGLMVIPLGDENGQEMMRYKKLEDGTLVGENFGPAAFVPMLQNTSR